MDQKSFIILQVAILCLLAYAATAASISSTPKPESTTSTTNVSNSNVTTENNTTNTTSAPEDSRMVEIGHHSNSSLILTTIAPTTNSTKGDDRSNRQYVSLGPGLSGPFNPFPYYIDPRLGGFTGPGVLASSCAYAYPNRRYSCYGLGRKK